MILIERVRKSPLMETEEIKELMEMGDDLITEINEIRVVFF